MSNYFDPGKLVKVWAVKCGNEACSNVRSEAHESWLNTDTDEKSAAEYFTNCHDWKKDENGVWFCENCKYEFAGAGRPKTQAE
jgi:ribosomal protein L37AE/L43A